MEKNYEEYVAGLMKRARAAQKIINDYSQEQIDELVKAIAFYTTRPDYMRVRNLQRKIYLSDEENLKLNVVLENKKITLREYFLSCIIKDYKIIRGLR